MPVTAASVATENPPKCTVCVGDHLFPRVGPFASRLSVLTLAIPRSVESASTQVVGDDDVGDGVKHKLDVVSVRRARLMAVNLLRCALVLRLKLSLDVRRRLLVALLAYNRNLIICS